MVVNHNLNSSLKKVKSSNKFGCFQSVKLDAALISKSTAYESIYVYFFKNDTSQISVLDDRGFRARIWSDILFRSFSNSILFIIESYIL